MQQYPFKNETEKRFFLRTQFSLWKNGGRSRLIEIYPSLYKGDFQRYCALMYALASHHKYKNLPFLKKWEMLICAHFMIVFAYPLLFLLLFLLFFPLFTLTLALILFDLFSLFF